MSVTKARSNLALTVRNHPNDREAITAARRNLAAAKLARSITDTVATAPPLTREQVDELILLLRGARP